MYAGSDAGHQPALHHHAAELDLVPCGAFEAKVAHEQRVLATALLSPEEQRGYGVLSSAHHGQVRRASQPTTIRAVILQGYKDLRTRELLRPPYHAQAGLHSSAQYGHCYTHAQEREHWLESTMDSVSSPCLRLTGNWTQACLLSISQDIQPAWKAMSPSCSGSCRVQALKVLCETWLEKLHKMNQVENVMKPYKFSRQQIQHNCFGCASSSLPTLHRALQVAGSEGGVRLGLRSITQ